MTTPNILESMKTICNMCDTKTYTPRMSQYMEELSTTAGSGKFEIELRNKRQKLQEKTQY